MRQYFFSQIYGAESIDVKTLPRILIIRTRFMQLGKLPNARIIDQNINFHTIFSNLIRNLCNALPRGHIQLDVPHSVLALKSPPEHFPLILRLNPSRPNLGPGIASQEDFDQLVTDAPARTRHQHPQRKTHRLYYNLKR